MKWSTYKVTSLRPTRVKDYCSPKLFHSTWMYMLKISRRGIIFTERH
jgi:hypothetical protein